MADKPDAESNIDRLIAFSVASDALGSHWWRLAYDLDSSAYTGTLEALQAATGAQRTICELVVHEALSPHCKWCGGARELVLKNETGDSIRKICPHCKGTGLHRFSDKERAKYLKVSMAMIRRNAKNIQRTMDTLQSADRRVSALMFERLNQLVD